MTRHFPPPAELKLYSEAAPDDEHDEAYHDGDPSTYRSSHAPPSYVDAVVSRETTNNRKEMSTSLGDSPAQLPFDGRIVESSPCLNPSLSLEQQPQVSSDPSQHRSQPSHRKLQRPARLRPELPQPPQSAPVPRSMTRPEHINELREIDLFGNKVYEDSPFEAGRRAQRSGGANPNDASSRVREYGQGHMPSIRPGEIMPATMQSRWLQTSIGIPAFFPPLEAPPFPPTGHTPIRAAHFPTELHPDNPPPPPQLTRSHSHRLPAPPLPPSRSHPHHSLPPQPRAADHIDPQRQPSLGRAMSQRHAPPTQLIRSHSHHHPPPPPLRHPYDPQDGVPPGLMPTGRYPAPDLGVPIHLSSNVPPPQSHLSRTPSQVQHQHPPQPGRPVPKDAHRHSLPARSPLVPPGHSPIRLPSQNIPTPASSNPSTPGSHALRDIVHGSPSPVSSASPRPDPSRAPRPTPKPVMPQLLAPLAAQENGLGHGGLQRSMSAAPGSGNKAGGGLLAKTRSILRKRNSSAGIRTHADGGISYAPPPDPPKWYENKVPLPSVREDGAGTPKSAKRLSKRR